MITIKNTQRRHPIDRTRITGLATSMLQKLEYAGFDLGIWFCGEKTIREYNHTYRHKDKVTDILSFPYHTELRPGDRIVITCEEDKNLGDLLICPEYVAATCHQWERDFDTHLTALLAHGIAHLLNYDHETDEEFAVMQKVEALLLTP